ncbi:MAG: M14 family metallocarboxypeptidase [Xanthomonadales bacterium]|jgi:hypothetical protein|nr:M14 family metallocarboxypeptidase [Xanthomonadales bacterium]
MIPITFKPLGTPGLAWGEAERCAWRARLTPQRSHAAEVLAPVAALAADWEVLDYGQIVDPLAPEAPYPLKALKSRDWNDALPTVLVTGGVHGYETSGVQGALLFLREHAQAYAGRVNLLVAPCVSPWAYAHIQRWNAHAVDPNRSFREPSPAAEAAQLMALVAPLQGKIVLHIDLHETTDSDEGEFRPALAARDGKAHEPGTIPDGFYLVGDSADPQLNFQRAIIEAVAKVTHIAPADADGKIIGAEVVSPGVILYPCRPLGLCAGLTEARLRTTTEVYPDSPRTTPAECNRAQAVAVSAAIDFLLTA